MWFAGRLARLSEAAASVESQRPFSGIVLAPVNGPPTTRGMINQPINHDEPHEIGQVIRAAKHRVVHPIRLCLDLLREGRPAGPPRAPSGVVAPILPAPQALLAQRPKPLSRVIHPAQFGRSQDGPQHRVGRVPSRRRPLREIRPVVGPVGRLRKAERTALNRLFISFLCLVHELHQLALHLPIFRRDKGTSGVLRPHALLHAEILPVHSTRAVAADAFRIATRPVTAEAANGGKHVRCPRELCAGPLPNTPRSASSDSSRRPDRPSPPGD